MLVNNKLNKCKGCEGIQATIEELDCFISEQGEKALNNKRFALNKSINTDKVKDAQRYRSILVKRSYNAGYLPNYNILDIINKAKQVIY